jgi:transposase
MDEREARIKQWEQRLAAVEQALAAERAENVRLRQQLAERDARIADLEQQLARRGKVYRPHPNRQRKTAETDRRRRQHRKHPGFFRQPPQAPESEIQNHDVHPERCSCGCIKLTPTGEIEEHLQVDIPEPKLEYHRFRHHLALCKKCGALVRGQDVREIPHSHIGPRARLLVGYARAYLGISLEKTCDLLYQLFGLSLSRAGALGHLKWGSKLCAPVVARFLELLKRSPVLHADETGWRINGKNVWAWCFCNPQLAVFLIDEHRSSEVLRQALGDSFAGTLVTDFYAAYNFLQAKKQRCLAHLLRELHELSEQIKPIFVTNHLDPLMAILQDALGLATQREELTPRQFKLQRKLIHVRLDQQIECRSTCPDVCRIYQRIVRHRDELLTFLDNPQVPATNNLGERDIRSLAAARSDGGVNRTARGATAFARIKSVVRTCQKNGRRFLDYGLHLAQASLAGQPLPLPLLDTG